MKKYSKEQVDIAKMKEYVARFSHGSRKLAKQGKSKEKLLNKRLIKRLAEERIDKENAPNFINGKTANYFNLCFDKSLQVLYLQYRFV